MISKLYFLPMCLILSLVKLWVQLNWNYRIVLKVLRKIIIVVLKLDCHARFDIAANIVMAKSALYQNVVPSKVIITTMLNDWIIERTFNLNWIKELLNQQAVIVVFCMIREYFVDVYPFDWNINESVTKITLQKRKIDVVLEEVKQSTLLNFRE